MKKFLIAGNWKMNTHIMDAERLASQICEGYKKINDNVEGLVCPPFTNLQTVRDVIGGSDIALGSQNCHFLPMGAYTGEISIPMLTSLGCTYILAGHSERRAYFSEDDSVVNKKACAILNSGLKAIVCIGETLQERQSNRTFEILQRQIKESLNFPDGLNVQNLVVAYEPVWAIGTGITATVEQIREAHSFIRSELIKQFGKLGEYILIQYGGSVSAENALAILEIENVNGALIGGASLKSDTFLSIINTAQNL